MKKDKLPKVNRDIKASKVRLVDEDGAMLGVVTLMEAMSQAASKALDLVEISPNVAPPVCKLMDFNRYKYDLKKRQQEAKKKQKKTALKEIKFRVNIGQGDFDIKTKKIRQFLDDGDKVKVSLWFKGREIVHRDKGRELFARLLETLGEAAKAETPPKFEGKQIMMILVKG